MEPTPVRPESRFVGRDSARRRIVGLLDQIRTAPEHLVIVGESGIGKTTLWNHALAQARDREFTTLSSRPGEDDWARPDTLVRDFAAESADVARAVAETTGPADVAAALLQAVRSLAERTPVVLAVDDLPWLDQSSTRHLRFVLRRVSEWPVVLLATARTLDPTGDPIRPLPELPGLRQLALGPMDMVELRAVLSDEQEALPRTVLERLQQDSGGNPLFALELARARASGHPASAQAAVQARLADLAPQVRLILELVAVGGPAGLAVLERLVGGEVEAAVRTAMACRLAVVDADFAVRCSHPVVASAVVTGLDPLARRDLHRRWLAHTSDPLQRAVHLARCTATPDLAVAAELDAAAQVAARRGASDLAADLAGSAVRVTPADDGEHDGRVVRHLVQLAACGQAGRARELTDRLLRDLPPGRTWGDAVTLRVLLDFVGAEEFLRVALLQEGIDAAQRQLLLDLLGWQLGLFKGRLAEGIATSSVALAAARRLGDEGRVARSSAILATTSMMAGYPQREAARWAAEVDDVDAGGTGSLGIWPGVLWARQAAWDGQLAEARTVLERAYRRAVELGSEFQRPYRLRDLAMLELWSGEVARADELVQEGLDAARDAANRQVEAWLALPAGQLAALRGDTAVAEWAVGVLEEWAGLADEPPRRAMAAHVRGIMATARGDTTAALAHYRQALTVLDDLGYVHPGVFRVMPDAVVAAGTAGDEPLAHDLAAKLAAAAIRLRSPWVAAWADAARGVAGLVAGEPRAVSDLEAAVNSLDGLGCRLDRTHLAWLLGASRTRAGQRTLARQDLVAAEHQAHEWRFVGWAAQLRLALDRLGDGGGLLTATEERVTELVRAGRRNREVAAELFVTESTVEAHLTRIYRKLGVRNRVELLAAAQPGGSPEHQHSLRQSPTGPDRF